MKRRFLSLLLCLTLLVGILPAGMLSLSAAAVENPQPVATGAGLTEDDPIVVSTYYELMDAFNRTAVSDTPLFVKLSRDVSYSGYECGTLVTKGQNITLDLAGYTISVEDKSNCSFPVIYGQDGTVTITDSTRYGISGGYGHLINGKIDYLYTLPDENTSVLTGKIIVKGGWFVNRCHSSTGKNTNCIYNSDQFGYGTYHTTYPDPNARLTMTGGAFEADVPIVFGQADRYSVVNGGQLRVKGRAGIKMTLDSSSQSFPMILKSTMYNYSSNDAFSGFDIKFEASFENKRTAADAIAVWRKIVPDYVYAYVDNELLAQGDHGVYYDAVGGMIGPLVKKNYVLTPLATINQISVTIDEPAAGKAMSYKASGDYQNGYDVSSYTSGTWSRGVQWTDGADFTSEYPVGSTFARGNRYAVFIKVQIAQKGFGFADESSMTATINGQKALLYKSGDNEYTVYKTFTLDKITVSKAPITVTAPKAGELPSYSAKTPGTGYAVQTGYSASGIKNGVAWMHEGGTAMKDGEKFEAGKKYMVLVFIEPSDTANYKFAASTDMTAAINGNTALIIPYSSVSYGIVCTFDLSNQITDMAVTIPSTRAGEQMKWTASAPGDADYQLQPTSSNFSYGGVMWKIDGATVVVGKTRYFEEGTTYAVTIFLEAKDGYTFAAQDDMSATVNGEAATVSRTSDTKANITYTFTGSSIGIVNAVDVTVTAPAVGEKPVLGATVPAGMEYEVYTAKLFGNGLAWFEIDGGDITALSNTDTFKAGKEYRVFVAVKPSEGYRFATTVTGTLNGQPGQVDVPGEYRVIEYTFPVLEEIPVTTINSLEVTVPEPVAGDEMPYFASVSEGKGYAVEEYDTDTYLNGVRWNDADGGIPVSDYRTFIAGETYTVVVSLVLTDDQKYRFADEDHITATVNGQAAEVNVWNSSNYGVTYTFTVPGEPAGGFILGDADDDGKVTILDATAIQRTLASLPTASYNEKAADADEDTKITILDATAIQRHLAGLATNPHIGQPDSSIR